MPLVEVSAIVCSTGSCYGALGHSSRARNAGGVDGRRDWPHWCVGHHRPNAHGHLVFRAAPAVGSHFECPLSDYNPAFEQG